MGQCTSTKDLWLKLEETYQSKKEDIEDNSIKTMKVKNIQKLLVSLFLNMMMLGKRKILKTLQMKEKNHVMMLKTKRRQRMM
jgi:hypothetical protein